VEYEMTKKKKKKVKQTHTLDRDANNRHFPIPEQWFPYSSFSYPNRL